MGIGVGLITIYDDKKLNFRNAKIKTYFHEDNKLLGFCQVCREITAEGFF